MNQKLDAAQQALIDQAREQEAMQWKTVAEERGQSRR